MDSFDAYIAPTLTLRKILNDDITLIIPDMQRDYCWDRRRVEIFTGEIVDLSATGGCVTMGLLYGYESPPCSHRLMLIDGQQRITTLYLLLGMLYRRTPQTWLRRLLISDNELDDDREPRLVYQVRNEAMYFMSDLVTNFFLNRDGRLSRIRHNGWYFASYDTDPTVTAVLDAIHAIDDVLEEASKREGWNFGEFAMYVADRLMFIYHDLGTRADAERMFVTINTTGEPLTVPQLMKTELYLTADDKDDFSRRWNELERWCFMHRAAPSDTGDELMSRLLEIRTALCDARGIPAVYDSGTLDSICECHHLYSKLVAEIPEAIDQVPERADHMFVLLPSLVYISRWGGGVTPLWSLLTNITRYRHVSSTGADTAVALRLVDGMPDGDIVSMLRVKGNYERLLNPEEKGKLKLLAEAGPRRTEVAELIRRADGHPMLNGSVMSVVSWCHDKSGGRVDIVRLRKYIDRVYEIWPGDIDCNPELDIVRRALSAMRHRAYPMPRRNGATLSLAWHDYDWQRLMTSSPGLIRQLIDHIPTDMPALQAMQRICDRFSDRNYEWYFLVHGNKEMTSCAHRVLMRPCKAFVGMHVAGSPDETHWYVGQCLLKPDIRLFTSIHPYGSRCIYTDHRTLNLALDIYWEPDSRHQFRLEVFARNDDDRKQREECDISSITDRSGLQLNFDKHRKRYYALFSDARSVVSAFNKLTCR